MKKTPTRHWSVKFLLASVEVVAVYLLARKLEEPPEEPNDLLMVREETKEENEYKTS